MSPRITKLAATLAIGLALALPALAQLQPTTNVPTESSALEAVYLAWPPEDPDPVPWVRTTLQDGRREVLYDSSGDLLSIAVQRQDSGRTLVAWSRAAGNGYDVALSRFEAGSWSEPVVVAGTSADERDPALAVAPDGTVHVLYSVAGEPPRVYHRQAPPDLSSWSDPVAVSGPKEPAAGARAVFHGGILHAVYEVDDFGFGSAQKRIVVARLTPGGFVSETVATTSNEGPVRPEIHAEGGRLWVEWIDAPGEIAWTLEGAGERFGALRYEGFDSPMEREIFVRGKIRYEATAGQAGR